MRWSDDPKIREGLTPMESVVLKICERKKPVFTGHVSQREIGQILVEGLDVILKERMKRGQRLRQEV
ncbi:hypothetical protein JW752_01640 [Candidatus Peregrinibacteria bacterium]|nr:hypothetical protein [Candidatus Peregrinibacteria bacterium]